MCLMVLGREVFFLLLCLQCIWMVCYIVELSKFGVDCHWGSSFSGAFSYADDVLLLAPYASALRTMLNICNFLLYRYPISLNLIQ